MITFWAKQIFLGFISFNRIRVGIESFSIFVKASKGAVWKSFKGFEFPELQRLTEFIVVVMVVYYV